MFDYKIISIIIPASVILKISMIKNESENLVVSFTFVIGELLFF